MASNFKCSFCGAKFVREKTLLVHVCEKKRRFLSKDEKHVRLGLRAFQRFFELTQGARSPKSFEDFATSPYYTAFVKFGSFLANTNPIYLSNYIDYVIKSGTKLDYWCRDALYEKYIVETVKIESADGALQRSIETMIDWADKNNSAWQHYFIYATPNRIVHDIKEGKISPWIILHTAGGKQALRNMNDEQLNLVGDIIDPKYWVRRFKELPGDVELVKLLVKESAIQ